MQPLSPLTDITITEGLTGTELTLSVCVCARAKNRRVIALQRPLVLSVGPRPAVARPTGCRVRTRLPPNSNGRLLLDS